MNMDISKVKLRIKKTGPGAAEQNSTASKLDNSSSVEEDFDMDDGDEGVDSNPINLSIRKSSRPCSAEPVQSEAPDKVQKKANITSEKEKAPKVKDKLEPEIKVTTRQKKLEKVNERRLEKEAVKEPQTETTAVNTHSKAKRRVKRLPADKTTVQNQTNKTDAGKVQIQKSDQQRPEMGREGKPVKEKDLQKNDSSGKENKSFSKPRRSVSKKSEKTEHVKEALQKPDSPEKSQKEKVVKEKAAKRKAVEALDLSKRSSSETPSKTRRLKTTAAEKTVAEVAKKINDATQAPNKTNGTSVKQKKTRNTSKKQQATSLQQPVDQTKDKKEASALEGSTLEGSALKGSAPEGSASRGSTLEGSTPGGSAPGGTAQLDDPTQTTSPDPQLTGNSPAQENASTQTASTEPGETLVKPPEKMEASPTCISGEDTPLPAELPAEGHPTPTFVKPTSPPPLVLPGQRNKPADPEDDEGIHSSHEGGSDISDSASEGSDDSGLNGNGTGSGKMANDPETPTDEIPTPTELKGHMCIFCDRNFPLEVEYRRHLNRHLVNVYYMHNTAKGQK